MSDPQESVAGLRILVVEDEALIAEEISDRLTQAGCEIVAVIDNGNAAISAAVEFRPDLILMDVHLKGRMDGIEAVERIHERLKVPVVYLTAHSDHGTLQRAKASSAFGYVLKPFHVRNLLASVEVAIDRFALEQRLEDSQLTHAIILGSIGDAVIATDVTGSVRFMNAEAERLTGWMLREAQGCACGAVLQFAAPERTEAHGDAVSRVLASRQAVNLGGDKMLCSRDGSNIAVEGTISPVIDDLGRLVGTAATLRDVTEARNARDALLTMADRLRAVVNTAVDGVMMLDINGTILSFNPACERLFGFLTNEIIGRSVEPILKSPLADEFGRQPTAAGSQQRAPVRVKARGTRGFCKNGMSFPCELSVGEASHGGKPVFVCVVHDLSDRRAMEADLLEAIGHEQKRFGDDLHDGLGQDLTGLALLMAAIHAQRAQQAIRKRRGPATRRRSDPACHPILPGNRARPVAGGRDAGRTGGGFARTGGSPELREGTSRRISRHRDFTARPQCRRIRPAVPDRAGGAVQRAQALACEGNHGHAGYRPGLCAAGSLR